MVNRLTIIAKKIVQLESFAIEESSFDSFSSRDYGGRHLCPGRLTPLGADVVLDLKLILTREGLPSTIRQV